MNTLTIRKIRTAKGWENDCFCIDGIPLHEHITALRREQGLEDIQPPLAPLDDLALTWTPDFDQPADARFMRWLMQQDRLNLPVLMCPDDFDFTCIVIAAEAEKTDRFVYWKRIGRVTHAIESREEEQAYGIAYVEAYTDADWERYSDPALYDVGSETWRAWIAANWQEEQYRRHIHYTHRCWQDERNIDWLCDCNWCFDRQQYESLAASRLY